MAGNGGLEVATQSGAGGGKKAVLHGETPGDVNPAKANGEISKEESFFDTTVARRKTGSRRGERRHALNTRPGISKVLLGMAASGILLVSVAARFLACFDALVPHRTTFRRLPSKVSTRRLAGREDGSDRSPVLGAGGGGPSHSSAFSLDNPLANPGECPEDLFESLHGIIPYEVTAPEQPIKLTADGGPESEVPLPRGQDGKSEELPPREVIYLAVMFAVGIAAALSGVAVAIDSSSRALQICTFVLGAVAVVMLAVAAGVYFKRRSEVRGRSEAVLGRRQRRRRPSWEDKVIEVRVTAGDEV